MPLLASPLPLVLCCAALLVLYLALTPALPAPALCALLLAFAALSLATLRMSHRVAPKPASPPAEGGGAAAPGGVLPPLEFHRALAPRAAAAKALYHWQVPLPSSLPGSRTHTSESAGSGTGGSGGGGGQVGTDVTGPEDLSVSVSAPWGQGGSGGSGGGSGGGGGGGGGGGDGLRRRGGAAAAGSGSAAAGVGLLSGGNGGGSSAAQPTAFRKLYTGRSAGRLERIKSAKAARATAAPAAAAPGSPPCTLGTVRAVQEGEEGKGGEEEEEEEEEEGAGEGALRQCGSAGEQLLQQQQEEEARWAEEVARGGAESAAAGGAPAGSPMDASARALFRVLRGLGLEGYFSALRAEALASLPLLQGMAAADAERTRRVLREAGMGRVGHREALLLALLPRRQGGGAAAAAPEQQHQQQQQQQQQRLPGVRNEGLRAALGRLSVSAGEVGDTPMVGAGEVPLRQ